MLGLDATHRTISPHLVLHIDVVDEGIGELEGEAHHIHQDDGEVWLHRAVQQPQGAAAQT